VGPLAADFPLGRDGTPSRFPIMTGVAAGGFALGDGTGQYRIRRYDAAGSPRVEWRRDAARGRKTEAEIGEERARLARAAARLRARANPESAGMGVPDVREERDFFHAHALEVDRAGRLWVRTQRGGTRATTFDVFDPGGAFIGSVDVRGRAGIYALDEGTFATVTLDEYDVERIGLWRMST
jgi:hypothetical protein